jgi:uncharacterized protein (TIGR03382 family)
MAAAYCMYSGSYYDPAPWTEQVCGADYEVPQGCPIHFVTGAPLDPANVRAERVAANGDVTQTPSTATIDGEDDRTFLLPDEFSCDCAETLTTIAFQHVSVAVPAAVAGESVRLWGVAVSGGEDEVMITAPAPCPVVEWPTDYEVGLACDRCPPPPDNSGGSHGDGPFGVDVGGCAAGGGDASLLLVAVAAFLPLVRRRRSGRVRASCGADSAGF